MPNAGHERPAAEVGDLRAGLHGRAAGVAGQGQHAVEPEVVEVVPRAAHVRARLPVAGDRAQHEARVGLAQPLPPEAQAVEHPRAEGLQQDVVVADQAQQRLATAVRLEIQAHGALAAVEGHEQRALGGVLGALEGRRSPAEVVPRAGVLDLRDLRAEIGQQQRAEAAGQQARQIEDPDPVQRAEHQAAAARSPRPSIARASSTVARRAPNVLGELTGLGDQVAVRAGHGAVRQVEVVLQAHAHGAAERGAPPPRAATGRARSR
jgi:hypothetical protein